MIVGSAGRDTIFAGEGHDIICGGGDVIEGGGGNDVIVGDAPTANPASSTGSRDMLLGSAGDDLVFASAGADVVLGQDGHDDLIGNGGRDIIVSGDGDDHAFGGPANDVMVGGDGDDGMWGNSDQMSGGDGNDYINGDNPTTPPPGPLNPAINPVPNNDSCAGGLGLDTVANCESAGDGSDPGGPAAPTIDLP